jgi:hypothetical protein
MHQVNLEGVGHFPMLDNPAQFNRLLTDFLALDSGASPRELQLKEEWKRRVRGEHRENLLTVFFFELTHHSHSHILQLQPNGEPLRKAERSVNALDPHHLIWLIPAEGFLNTPANILRCRGCFVLTDHRRWTMVFHRQSSMVNRLL